MKNLIKSDYLKIPFLLSIIVINFIYYKYIFSSWGLEHLFLIVFSVILPFVFLFPGFIIFFRILKDSKLRVSMAWGLASILMSFYSQLLGLTGHLNKKNILISDYFHISINGLL